MPTLRKPKKRPRAKTPTREERNEVYGTRLWRRLRESHLMQHPLCEICEARGKTVPAVDVHHRDSFLNYEGEMRLEKAYDPANLMSVCRRCHNWLHRSHRTQWMTIEAIVEMIKQQENDAK